MFNIRNTILSIVGIAPLLFTLTCQAGAREEADRLAEQQAEIAKRATPMDVEVSVPFDEAEAEEKAQVGNVTLSGVLYHRIDGVGRDSTLLAFMAPRSFVGGVEVRLYPATKYVTAFVKEAEAYDKQQQDHNYTLQLKNIKFNESAKNYKLKTTTDNFGRYTFKNLSPGRYWLSTNDFEVKGSYVGEVADGSDAYVDGYGNMYYTPRYRRVNIPTSSRLIYSEFIDVPNKAVVDVESRARQIPGTLRN